MLIHLGFHGVKVALGPPWWALVFFSRSLSCQTGFFSNENVVHFCDNQNFMELRLWYFPMIRYLAMVFLKR
jgi:hypothetical protein